MMVLARLQETRTRLTNNISYLLHIDQTTYAMADKIGPLDTKGCPVDTTLGPTTRVGYEKKKG